MKSTSEVYIPSDDYYVRRIIPIIGWIGRVPPRAIDVDRIIYWNIDYHRVRRFDPDAVLIFYYILFFCCLQISLLHDLPAQFLNHVHDVFLLAQKGVAQFPRLVELFAH